MKKILLTGCLLIAVLSTEAQTQKTLDSTATGATPKEQILKVDGDVTAWNALIECLDLSTESNVKVQAVKRWLISQLQPQVKQPETAAVHKQPNKK
jgi:hypothetical protein